MRSEFIKTLVELARKDPRVILLTGDLGYMALEPFADEFPDRFINVGVAEQNMAGISTGLAEAGFIPFVYSIATFASMRAYEFIRNGPIVHNLKVRIIAMGGGFDYGTGGITHHALEDIALMRTQPNLTLVSPCDAPQARNALLKTWDNAGPIYYRLSKDNSLLVKGIAGEFNLDAPQIIGTGKDIAIITTGAITSEAVKALEILKISGFDSTLIILACLNPAPIKRISEIISGFELVATIEEHYINCGLGSLISEIIAEASLNSKLIRYGVRETSDSISGSVSFMRRKHGLNAEAIAENTKSALLKTRRPQ